MTAAMKGVRYGNPAEAEAGALEMGPLIEERAVKAVAEKVERAVKQGAKLVCGGKRAEGRGYFFEPTLLTDTDNSMDIMKEETFGPVLPVSAFDTLDQVIALANDCEFGLTSSVYTTNLNEAFYVTRRPAIRRNLHQPRKLRSHAGVSTRAGKNPASAARTANTVWKNICKPKSFIWKPTFNAALKPR
uniref:Aldehyde dehydrogenase A n=1 Tax=Neisseria meningitidis alpha275 TaxID=295996 RepID=C6SJS4_NEIME|nr:aldehyde dehydrogenase A [Neisseria meningitidis alpha275]